MGGPIGRFKNRISPSAMDFVGKVLGLGLGVYGSLGTEGPSLVGTVSPRGKVCLEVIVGFAVVTCGVIGVQTLRYLSEEVYCLLHSFYSRAMTKIYQRSSLKCIFLQVGLWHKTLTSIWKGGFLCRFFLLVWCQGVLRFWRGTLYYALQIFLPQTLVLGKVMVASPRCEQKLNR